MVGAVLSTSVCTSPGASAAAGLCWHAVLRLAMLTLALLAAATASQAQGDKPLRFRARSDVSASAPTSAPASALTQQLLSEAERNFIASLPVVRVGVPTPPAQPYESISPDGVVSGIHPDMLTALGAAFGIRMVPVQLPNWSAVLQAARMKEIDVVMTLGVTAERMQYLEFTLGATPLPGALFARVGAPPVDLAHARFALERDYMANDFVRRQFPEATILTEEDTIGALRAVAQSRADVYLGSLLETSDWLSRNPVPGVEATRLMSFGTGYYHFGVRKDWAPLAAILNKGIQTLRSAPNDELDAALATLPPALRPAAPLHLPASEAAALVRHPVWRIGAVRGLTSLNDIDERAVHSGIAAEYTEQIARKLGVAVQVTPYASVAHMLEALRGGEIDLVPFLTRTKRRAAEFSFSDAYLEMPYMLVTRSDAPLYWNLDSLAGLRLALAQEHPLRDILAERYPRIRVVDAANGNEAMSMVGRGDADAAVEVKLFANLRINGDNDGLLRAATNIEELPAQFHFAASRAGAELIPLVNRALSEIGPAERTRMLRRWVAVDLHPAFPWRRWLPFVGVAGLALLTVAVVTAVWMHRLRREVRARRRSEELLTDIAATVPGVAFRYSLNDQGAIRNRFVTPGATRFFGIELGAQGTVLYNLAPCLRPEHRQAALAMELACMHSGERFKITVAFQVPGASERWLHAEAVQTRSSQGRNVWTGYVVDVTTERELQERLAEQARSRNLLLAAASHELRAPTHNLPLALETMDANALGGNDAASLRIAQRSAQLLSQLLDDVLDAARFESGPLPLHPRSFALHEMLHELRDAWAIEAQAKGLSFSLDIAQDLPRSIHQDPLRLRQVLMNLLSNATKYTSDGGVTLQASGTAQMLSFVVRDTGAGMAAASQEQLFKAFSTLDAQPAQSSAPAAAPAPASSGLGLLIARQLAERMGGSISLHSELGRGTEVTLVLPAVAAAQAGFGVGSGVNAGVNVDVDVDVDLGAPPAADRGNRVVVCDDDPTSRMLTAQMLALRGFDVREASSGALALQALREGHDSALVTDLDMPVMSGVELMRELRAVEAAQPAGSARTVIVVCSGNAATQPGRSGTAALYDAYLIKPVQIDTLVRTLAELGVRA